MRKEIIALLAHFQISNANLVILPYDITQEDGGLRQWRSLRSSRSRSSEPKCPDPNADFITYNYSDCRCRHFLSAQNLPGVQIPCKYDPNIQSGCMCREGYWKEDDSEKCVTEYECWPKDNGMCQGENTIFVPCADTCHLGDTCEGIYGRRVGRSLEDEMVEDPNEFPKSPQPVCELRRTGGCVNDCRCKPGFVWEKSSPDLDTLTTNCIKKSSCPRCYDYSNENLDKELEPNLSFKPPQQCDEKIPGKFSNIQYDKKQKTLWCAANPNYSSAAIGPRFVLVNVKEKYLFRVKKSLKNVCKLVRESACAKAIQSEQGLEILDFTDGRDLSKHFDECRVINSDIGYVNSLKRLFAAEYRSISNWPVFME